MTLTATRLDLAALNAMDRDAFVAAVGPTFENSPWVAQAAWARRPFADTDALHAAMLDVVREAPHERRIRRRRRALHHQMLAVEEVS